MAQDPIDLHEIDEKLGLLKKTAEELERMSDGFPALDRNIRRVLASIKMLELNISGVNASS